MPQKKNMNYPKELIEQCILLSPQKVCKGGKYSKFVELLNDSTNFLDQINPSLTTRFYCVINNIHEIPRCCCGEFVMANKKDNKLGFTQYCSPTCSRSNKTVSPEIELCLSNREWLYDQRITQRKSKETIAEELGCSITPVNKWIKIHEIADVKYNKSNVELLDRLENRDWLYHDHKILKKTCETIANEIGSSKSTVSIYLSKYGIDANLSNSYPKEQKPSGECMEVVDYIKSIYFGEIIIDAYGIIGELQLDIYIPELNFAIEYNGVYSHKFRPEIPVDKFSQRKDERYHVEKTNRCENKGIQLIHIFSGSWKTKKDLWKSVIASKLGVTERTIYARKCNVVELTVHEKNSFLDANHLQGKDKSIYKFGLFYGGELVSLITFTGARYNKNFQWELNRFCVKQNTSVVGGFSKLLSHFRKIETGSIISYADRTYSNGNMYAKNGFELLHTNKPAYHYIAKNSEIMQHRGKFRKKYIADDANRHLTEEEIMFDNGYSKVYDCGTLAFGLI